MTSDGRSGRAIKDTRVYQSIEQLLWESPGLAANSWLMHRKGIIEMIEDEGERAPPLAMIFREDHEETEVPNSTRIDIIDLMLHSRRPFLVIRRIR